MTKKEKIKNVLFTEWDLRRARSEKKRARNSMYAKRWRDCERAIDKWERSLGRTLTVIEYAEIKKSYGISLQSTSEAASSLTPSKHTT